MVAQWTCILERNNQYGIILERNNQYWKGIINSHSKSEINYTE